MGRRKQKDAHGVAVGTRYRDSGEANYADAEEGGVMDSSSDEDIELHTLHKAETRSGRVRRRIQRVAEEPKLRSVLWRWFLFVVIMALMVAMLVQLYSSYGEFITDQIFPPRVSSGAIVCPNGTVTSDYQLSFHKVEWTDEDGGWMVLNATKPKDSLEFALLEDASALAQTRWEDDNTLLVWTTNTSACAKILVFSV